MQWRGRRQSGNVIDMRGRGGARGGGGGNLAGLLPLLLGGLLGGGRRGRGGFGGGRGGGGGGGRGGCGGIGCGAILLILLVLLVLSGINPLALLGGGASAPAPRETPGATGTSGASGSTTTSARGGEAGGLQDEAGQFVATILADTEDTWNRLFRESGGTYQEPQLVLFDNMVRSECGISGSATGPFYCPLDQRVFMDLAFFRQLERLGARGEAAIAYVIAHEVGHHVQHQQGILQEARAEQQRLPQADANALQVRVELQADCYAGVWAHHADRQRGLFTQGDIQDALDAAAAVGSDHLARQSGRPVQPESFTHGTSAQRTQWFRRGFESGDPATCAL
jgi:uncharacterized protein